MPKAKKELMECLYDCPTHCGETAAFVQPSADVELLKTSGLAGYDLVYIADLTQKHVFMFGTPGGAGISCPLDLALPVHEQAHQKAAQGEVLTYQWSAGEGEETSFFESTLLALKDQKGQVGSVLGLVKNITSIAYGSLHNQTLKEVRGKTFAQILLAAREEERKNISSALHDEIGSAAVILTSLLSMVKQSVQSQDQKQALQDIAALDKQIKDCIERVKNIVVSLRPPQLETIELSDALQELLHQVTQHRDIQHSFTLKTADDLPICDQVKIVLYRVAQESLNNILKHSGATKIEVSLTRGIKDVTLKISDNGKGFKPSKQRSIKHIGLLSMRDSVAYLGGNFKLTTALGKGTRIVVKCPKVVYGVNDYEYKSGIS